ncbi:hypothetical protein GLYMA_15G058500v4 [Glycine max]|uniref:Uncharacterized protein n=1 Tax=Glycine max TaxID=3847 RepID=A0A0R0G5P4_SOYBN|nr:hypothetical protein GYH30_041470 [Glycine max]KRH10616.1 hypothetical protein GLYMA_15G058500v4 [Glycine max]
MDVDACGMHIPSHFPIMFFSSCLFVSSYNIFEQTISSAILSKPCVCVYARPRVCLNLFCNKLRVPVFFKLKNI